MYADVVFPLKLPPLTYEIPLNAPSDLKGRLVKAPLMGKNIYGLVIDTMERSEVERERNIKKIQDVHQRFASESFISLLKWLSDHYLNPMGVALKSSFFEEATSEIKKQKAKIKSKSQISESVIKNISHSLLTLVCGSIKSNNYKSFIFHAPSISFEHSLLFKILNETASEVNGVIILVPEINQIERLLPVIKNIFGERLSILHSKLSKGKRVEAVKKIITGQSDVILGTRSAVLAPLKNISFIAVMGEHSSSYKGEEGLRYNGRDVAVMRGFIEKSCVLLSSICPSIESIYNSTIGKYTLLRETQNTVPRTQNTEHRAQTGGSYSLSQSFIEFKRPRIKIINIKESKPKGLAISGEILKKTKELLSKNERPLFLINKKGYSLIRCDDCGYTAICKNCHTPLVFYKSAGMLRCHLCRYETVVFENCKECGGFNIKSLGSGTEKVKDELEKFLKTEVFLIEKKQLLAKKSHTLGLSAACYQNNSNVTSLIVGTDYAARKIWDEAFSAVIFVNMSMMLAQPDFRAYERAFQDVVQISQIVRTDGSIFLQTWDPKNKALRFIKNYDFDSFYKYELHQRKVMDYPPFSKIIIFNIFLKRVYPELLHNIQKIIEDFKTTGIELLGPVEIPSTIKLYNHCIQTLLKSKDRKLMHFGAKGIVDRLEKLKGIKVRVDVDPLRI